MRIIPPGRNIGVVTLFMVGILVVLALMWLVTRAA